MAEQRRKGNVAERVCRATAASYFTATVLMSHHLSEPDTGGAESAWHQWLMRLLG
ncbi:hypothetical protein [Streptomyces sp. NPDC058086]|uniref:hypothetical protein n=1 Tax=Streptomyces sp. NPDC058086 TaxID=3346334 RepID=UPI0036F18752